MDTNGNRRADLRVAIIGAGPGGLCMAIKLKEAGFENIVLLEKGDAVGGTWYHNRYPGCAVDVQCDLYSFSFEIKPDWTRPYARQPEILAYMQKLAEDRDVVRHCRFGVAVDGADWSDDTAEWNVRLASGEVVTADVVVSAIGMFNDLVTPDIEGLDSFAGTRFHSARWNWDHDLSGERVAVVGSAASAVQFVPEIVATAGQVHLFQRSANWVLPKEDDPYTTEEIERFRADPSIVLARRQMIFERIDAFMTFHDREVLAGREQAGLDAMAEVEDPEVRAKLRPTHPFGCKRPLVSNDYYAAFNRPNLELVTDPIDRITPTSVITADGSERTVDTLILATGFAATKYLSAIDVTGREGRRLADAWNEGAQAHLGVTTAGFPNLFMLYGPNTNNGSILTMIEAQVAHAVAHIGRLADEHLAWIDVRPEPMARWNDEIQEAIDGVEVWQASCNGYYRSPSGRVVTQWPHSMTHFAACLAEPDPAEYEVAPRG